MSSPFTFFSITRSRNKGKLPAAVENIINLDKLRAVLFDEADATMLATPINLDGNLMLVMILELIIIDDQLTVYIHGNSPLCTKFGKQLPLYI